MWKSKSNITYHGVGNYSTMWKVNYKNFHIPQFMHKTSAVHEVILIPDYRPQAEKKMILSQP